ncbi:MAG: NDP-hexose 2,3-dehydratase family protein [Bifidobacteriaceae bacterium]|jgi:oxidase EvaA|nr:NDP-hexose 2,3-dehydratase family protein [Bifidobacteriaceae bacterium]
MNDKQDLELAELFIKSLFDENTAHSLDEILDWVAERNVNTFVDIKKTSLDALEQWFYDENAGEIRNTNRSFFTITGIRETLRNADSEHERIIEQPIILQDEIGYLGIIAKKIGGTLHFLMQAKIEPGNVNKIQLSPTIQATKSNFTRAHGGSSPAYLDFFVNSAEYRIVVDQLQSEQSSRFLGKRNRNVLIYLEPETEIAVLPTHKWMTLGQIKELMRVENLVNMDTRTVISCIPLYDFARRTKGIMQSIPIDVFAQKLEKMSRKNPNDDAPALRNSVITAPNQHTIATAYNCINDYKMLTDIKRDLIPLNELKGWNWVNGEFVQTEVLENTAQADFKVIFADIEINGREVRKWGQPLFEATGIATFGLFTATFDGVQKFLVRATPEIGSFDYIEFGPTLQLEASAKPKDAVQKLLLTKYATKQGVLRDVILSEEGGRFYHEQNRNLIIALTKSDLTKLSLPNGYFWMTFADLNQLVQVNNCLNIQLRNLLALVKV